MKIERYLLGYMYSGWNGQNIPEFIKREDIISVIEVEGAIYLIYVVNDTPTKE